MFRPTASFLTLLTAFASRIALAQGATTAVAPTEIDRTGWVVTADSSQPNYGIYNAFDDNVNTVWHTGFNPDVPLPHTVVIDMNNQYSVGGFSYTPRQDGNPNGNVADHTIETSLDGNVWTTASQGVWANDATIKTTLWTPVIARYVRFTAKSEVNGNQWSCAAEFNVVTNPHSALPRANWVVSADSAETDIQNWGPQYAVDGSAETVWHTQWRAANPPLPHYYTIDTGAMSNVGGLSYLPRLPSTGANGRIGQYQVQNSPDGNNWATVAQGTWPDSAAMKYVEWAPVIARYWRLVAITEAGNRGPWTCAAEINLLDGSAQLANFVVTVDSQETAAVNCSGVRAIDGDTTTVWHTQWSGNNVPGFPHFITIDMQVAMPVKALAYVPRQDGNSNGNIGQHVIDVSTDGNNWVTVATGAFPDNALTKTVIFQETLARYVRLTAQSEAGNRGPWSSAAEIQLQYDTTYVAPTPQVKGAWGLTIDFPLVPVAAGVLYNTGGILAWSSWYASGFENSPGGETLTATYMPATGTVTNVEVTNIQHDMFCPGISLDFNGRMVVTGGNDAPRTSIYDPPSAGWIFAHDMQIARGYQASTTLSNGQVFTIGGSWSGGIFKKPGEVYDPPSDTWTLLNGADVTPMLTNDAAGLYRADNHAWLFAWKNNAIFQAGPSIAMNWYSIANGGGVTGAGARGDAPDQMCGNAVMYDALNGKILTMGGSPSYSGANAVSNAYVITIGNVGAQAQVQKIANMAYTRIFANGVALPNGQVFVVGGQSFGSPFNDDSSIMYPELWSPTTQQWTVMTPMAVGRNYHSIGLLLPDATVLVGGGGLCDGCEMNHYDGQVWTPPYLFNAQGGKATRPVINSISAATIGVGGSITVKTDSAISSFALMRIGTATHTVDTDQRRIPAVFSSTGINTYKVNIPGDAGIALPGYWFVFAINSAGVPSISKTIKITL